MKGNSMLTLRNRHFFLIDLVLLPAAALLTFALQLDVAWLALRLKLG